MDNSPIWDEALAALPRGTSVDHLRRDLGFVHVAARPTSADYDRYLELVSLFRSVSYNADQIWRKAPFLVVDVGFNAILLRANQDLGYLLQQSGDAAGLREIQRMDGRARLALESRWSHEDGIYHSYDSRRNETIRKPSIGSLLPLFADGTVASRHPALIRRLEQWLTAVKYGVPSYQPGEPEFDARRYWRGPVWLIVNWMIIDGLRRNAAHDLANDLRQQSLELVMKGAPLGGSDFSWSAAMVLLLQSL